LVFNLAVDYRFGHVLAMKLLLFVLLGLPGILLAQGGLPNNARERAERTVKAMGMKIDSVLAVSPIGFSEI
jgi:hypothetical protein